MTAPAREEKIYGVAACLRVFERRPADIIRAYVAEAVLPRVKALLRYCAAQRRAYHVVSDEELQRITKSVHHEGLCLLVRSVAAPDFEALCQRLAASGTPEVLVYLDGVENPHNVGAILRSCGHFGVSTLLGEAGRLPALSAAALRVAMGAGEVVRVVHVPDGLEALRRLRALGFELLATLSTGASPLFEVELPARVVWLVGAEGPGLSPSARGLATRSVTIPGSGEVESLNVSVATAVVLAEQWRQRHRAPAAPPRPASAARPAPAKAAPSRGGRGRTGPGRR